MKILLAIGGNSLIKDEKHQTVQDQYEAICETTKYIADLIENEHQVIITHGNGPQVGFILLRSEYSRGFLHEVPLDSIVADTQGAIGYQIQQALENELFKRHIKRHIITVVTQTLVDANDPAFNNPSKPIGPFYKKEEALKRIQEEGWKMVEDAGRGFRRVVPSPKPIRIIEAKIIEKLIDDGAVVIACGGGGVPVISINGILKGVEAVIDKDLASALLAVSVGVDLFLISTAVEKVYLNFNKPNQKPIDRMSIKEARTYLEEGHFGKGSMEPKILA
ncbi:MAG: carbamate kinase, partial [bacterium]|nr:carbamate kinase [bacterium]